MAHRWHPRLPHDLTVRNPDGTKARGGILSAWDPAILGRTLVRTFGGGQTGFMGIAIPVFESGGFKR